MTILGINIAHNSSVAVTDNFGLALYALEEERISRIKNHIGIPRQSLRIILDNIDVAQINKLVIGGNSKLPLQVARRMLYGLESNPSNPEGGWWSMAPGSKFFYNEKTDARTLIEIKIRSLLPKDIKEIPIHWENHHDSHLGCALANFRNTPVLLVSFDGEGDGESGAIAKNENGKLQSLLRVDRLDSLGLLYSAVTKRYNFKAGHHEGKITGLAAFGSYSTAVDVLLSHIQIRDGKIELIRAKSLIQKITSLSLSHMGVSVKKFRTLTEIVDIAESQTENYADLAFAIQFALEKSIIEILDYYINKTKIDNVSLAGGVFSNVKLNQKISEMDSVRDVRVFPNMGDGGIALGGIWSYLNKSDSLRGKLYEHMYLAPLCVNEDSQTLATSMGDNNLIIKQFEPESIYKDIANEISSSKIVAVHNGNMEFGPRALGNRSILLDPRDQKIILKLNKRLNRTEFMPLAPIVLDRFFHDYFMICPSQSLDPFYFMTMTCKVKDHFVSSIPAVVHKDQTARPQVVSFKTNSYVTRILEEYYYLTNIPILVNTSFNVHEEPINYSLSDSIEVLKRGAIDVLYFEKYKISSNVQYV
jgi:carbamoyltransferase